MKLNALVSAAVGAAIMVLGVKQSTHAIVAVDFDNLFRQEVLPGQFSGVVALQNEAFGSFCTGSLLTGGQYILTAAHCLTKGNTLNPELINQPFFANFNLASGLIQVPIRNLFILPTWQGSILQGNDLALLSLLEPAPAEAEQYDIYREMNELGQTFTKVGYGRVGTGVTGDFSPNGLTAFFGQNQFEGTESDLVNLVNFPLGDVAPLSQLLFDFDSGRTANNLLGSLGLGNNEVSGGKGDSGGPTFIGNRIAGITSYRVGGYGLIAPTDMDGVMNSSFGELAGDARVSTYSSFIDEVLSGNVIPSGENTAAVPEPTTIMGSVAFGLWVLKRRRVRSPDRATRFVKKSTVKH